MNIQNTKTCYIYTISFTEEEWEIIKDARMPDTLTGHLWSSELESILEECEVYYMSEQVEITLNDNNTQLLENVIQKFLDTAEVV